MGEAVQLAIKMVQATSEYAILWPISVSAKLIPALLQRLNLKKEARG